MTCSAFLGDLPDRNPGATTKDKENRRVPFNPKGQVAAILERTVPMRKPRNNSAALASLRRGT